MTTRPLKRYLEARDALARGDPEAAAGAVEEAFGAQQGNTFIRQNLDQLLDHESLAGEAVLDLVRVEMQRRDQDDDGSD